MASTCVHTVCTHIHTCTYAYENIQKTAGRLFNRAVGTAGEWGSSLFLAVFEQKLVLYREVVEKVLDGGWTEFFQPRASDFLPFGLSGI